MNKIEIAKNNISIIKEKIANQQSKITDELIILKINLSKLKTANKELNFIINNCDSLRSVILPGHNNNYTLREDGTMIYNPTGALKSLRKGKNYRLGYCGKWRKTVALGTLMKLYFNGVKCLTEKCDNFVTELNKKTCSSCRESYYSRRYAKQIAYRREQSLRITKFHVGRTLGFLKGEISEELYQFYKKTLEFKREVAKEQGIHINKLNN